MIDPHFVEAAVACSEDDRPPVASWLREHGLEATDAAIGLLATGSLEQFERAFRVRLAGSPPPLSLPVPPELGGRVRAVTIAGPGDRFAS